MFAIAAPLGVAAASDLVIADFESPTYGEWTTTGEAFGSGPARGTLPGQMQVSGFKGERLVNSFYQGDATGKQTTHGILRLAFAPGGHRVRVTFLNRVVAQPAEVEVLVQDGKITPVSIKLTEAGVALVQTKSVRTGGTAYGRRTKIGSDETARYSLSARADPPVTYQIKDQMSYAR